MYIHTCICIRVYSYDCLYTYIHMHICTYTYSYVYICIHIYSCVYVYIGYSSVELYVGYSYMHICLQALRELHIENNRLKSLRGLHPQPALERLWIKGVDVCISQVRWRATSLPRPCASRPSCVCVYVYRHMCIHHREPGGGPRVCQDHVPDGRRLKPAPHRGSGHRAGDPRAGDAEP